MIVVGAILIAILGTLWQLIDVITGHPLSHHYQELYLVYLAVWQAVVLYFEWKDR